MNVVIPEEQNGTDHAKKNGNEPPAKEEPAPVKILRAESAFTKSVGKMNTARKRLTFADELGDPISENVFVEHLHYSSNNYSSTEMPKDCCSVS